MPYSRSENIILCKKFNVIFEAYKYLFTNTAPVKEAVISGPYNGHDYKCRIDKKCRKNK